MLQRRPVLDVRRAQFVKAPPPNPLEDAALGLSIATTVPGIFNFLKLAGPPLSAVVALLDVAMGVVGMVVIFIEDSASGP